MSYLDNKSCHPPHTEKNIALSLAWHILQIVTDNRNNRLQEIKDLLLKEKNPEIIIDNSFTKLFQPRKHGSNGKNTITFTKTFIPNCKFSTWQSKELQNMLERPKFETKTITKLPKLTGLFLCDNCVYHKTGYIIPY